MPPREYRRHLSRIGQRQVPEYLVEEIKTLVDILFPIVGVINSSTNRNIYNTILSIAMDAQTEMLREILLIDKERRIKAERNNHLYSNVTTESITSYAKEKKIIL